MAGVQSIFLTNWKGFFVVVCFGFGAGGSHVAQALKLAFVADAGLELLLTLLVPLLKF